MEMRYFELGLGNSIEEDWETFDYSMCIKGIREPENFEEANKFIKKDLEKIGYKTVVSITEITEYEAKNFFDWESILKAPIFGMMEKYIVEMRKNYTDEWDNYIGDYIEAKTGEEAIEYAIQWLVENGMEEEEIKNLDFRVKKY